MANEITPPLGNLAKAIIAVINAVKGIEKNMLIGKGNYAYSGVSDKEVKEILRGPMAANGLTLLPIGVKAKSEVSRWTENDSNKQSVFTEVNTRYLLLHESGESVELEGYGHGVDAQDKGAGKATTYALKYTLLYTFLIPTGKIDDADVEHSDTHEAPPKLSDAQRKAVRDAVDKIPSFLTHQALLDFRNQQPDFVKNDAQFNTAGEGQYKKIELDLATKKNGALENSLDRSALKTQHV